MKAIAPIETTSADPSQLNLAEVPDPSLGPGQMRIQVRASGVNRADIVQRKGLYPPPPGASDILGLEVAGEIIQLDKSVKGYQIGDKVMALLPGGGYAEQVCVEAGLAMRIPPGLSFEQAAAIPEVFITAHHNLFHLGGLTREMNALIHAGASGVGTAGIQLHDGGAVGKTFVTVSSEAKAAACEALGAVPILYRETNFTDYILKRTNDLGVNVILDPVGGSYFEQNLKTLTVGGRLVIIGTMGGKQAEVDLSYVLRRRIRVIGSALRTLPLNEKIEAVLRFERDFRTHLDQGVIKPVMDTVFPFSEAKQAHERMESNLNIGKIVLSWDA